MFVQQFFIKGIAHSSYLVGGSRHCAIVDPRRDVGIYLEAAKDMGMEITHILETHLHADFASGHTDLAEITGGVIYAPGKCAFNHVEVKEGLSFDIDHLHFEVLETPGHTPEHVSYVVTDKSRGEEPVSLFCGDTLFVGDVGRPDLFPSIAGELAGKLYDSLHNKLLKLPPHCEVYPAHGAGSLCGRAMGAKRSSTVGYELKYNKACGIPSRAEFIQSLTTNMPPAPDHFSRLSAFNAEGPERVFGASPLKALSVKEFGRLREHHETLVLDTRSYAAFGGVHVPGSVHVDFGGNFATFAAWVLPPGRDILLVSTGREEAEAAAMWLRRVGLDSISGFLEEGLFGWCREGMKADNVLQLASADLEGYLKSSPGTGIIDVRSPGEFAFGHIRGAMNVPAPDLRTPPEELDKKSEYLVICGTGHRSSLGCSLLKQQGFSRVINVAGGMTAYGAVCGTK